MKKYLLTMGVIALFAVGFAASDEDSSKSNSESSFEQAEQKQETEAERQANEEQQKIKKVAEIAYQMGYNTRRETWGQSISSESYGRMEYTMRYGREPEDEGQSERWGVFIENYKKGFSDAAGDIMKKYDEENF